MSINILSKFNSQRSVSHQKSGDSGDLQKLKKHRNDYRPPRENLSAAEIRRRVKEGINKKSHVTLSTKGQQVSQFMDDKVPLKKPNAPTANQLAAAARREAKERGEEVVEPAVARHSDVGINDPNDVVTKEKLKDLVSSGGFNFNSRESQVLQEILAKDS